MATETALPTSDDLEAAVEALAVAMARTGADGCLLQVNAGFRSLFGDTVPTGADGLRGVLLSAGVADPAGVIEDSFAGPRDLILCRGGRQRPVRLASHRRADGAAIHLLHELRDDGPLHARRAELQSLIAHDLRSPLAVIQGYAGLLATGRPGPLNQTQAEFLAGIDVKIIEVTRLLDDFLDLSRLEAGALALQLGPVEVSELIDQVAEEHGRAADARQVTLTTAVDPDDLTLVADPLRLKQVIDNLVGNAVKYNHAGGWVDLAVTLQDTMVSVRVADGGPGLSDDDRACLFEPFGRGDAGKSVAGSGLGLAIVHHLVTLHGGTIEVDGSLGAGTVFTVRLPRSGVADGAPERH